MCYVVVMNNSTNGLKATSSPTPSPAPTGSSNFADTALNVGVIHVRLGDTYITVGVSYCFLQHKSQVA